MSKRSRRRRDTNDLSLTQLLPSPPLFRTSFTINPYSVLREIEDNRYYSPDPVPLRSDGQPVHYRAREPHADPARHLRKFTAQTKAVIGVVNNPLNPAILCVRRRIRKEVLHAFKKTGKGGNRKPRFTERSKIKC